VLYVSDVVLDVFTSCCASAYCLRIYFSQFIRNLFFFVALLCGVLYCVGILVLDYLMYGVYFSIFESTVRVQFSPMLFPARLDVFISAVELPLMSLVC
jgi:hypothetical protein